MTNVFSYPRLSRLNRRNGRSYFLFWDGLRAAGLAPAGVVRFFGTAAVAVDGERAATLARSEARL